MKKILFYCSLSLLIFFIPIEGQVSHVNAMSQEEPYLYLTQNDEPDMEDEAETEENIQNDQETTDDPDEEPDFVLIPTFILLTVIIGILLYNFTKDREH